MTKFIPKHSTVAAYLALFVALGTGTATAAVHLHAGQVTAREIRTGAVRSSEIRNGSIKLADLDPSIRPVKTNKLFRAAVADSLLDPGTKAAVDAIAGAVKGEKGDPGATVSGPAGPAGPAAVTTRETVQPVDLQPGQTGGVAATCAPGERLIGGGGRFAAVGQTAATMTQNAPEGAGWAVAFQNDGPSAGRVHAFAICAV